MSGSREYGRGEDRYSAASFSLSPLIDDGIDAKPVRDHPLRTVRRNPADG